MYTTRQFSFNQAAYDQPPPQNLNESGKKAAEVSIEKVYCQKNLFDEIDENKNPNFDQMMFDSPDKENNLPLEDYIDDMLNKRGHNFEEKISPPNLKQKWNKGDQMFKGKFKSGVTPKVDRPVYKPLKIKKKDDGKGKPPKGKPESNIESSDSKEVSKNPFLEITPQMKRKVRKCSFENNENMVLDFSSPTRTKKLVCETPIPAKKFARIPRVQDDDSSSERENAYQFYERFNDRGSRFNEDFIEI